MAELVGKIEKILRKNPSRMYSKEEILNMLAPKKMERELEAKSTLRESKTEVHAKCRGDRLLQVAQVLIFFLGKHRDAF